MLILSGRRNTAGHGVSYRMGVLALAAFVASFGGAWAPGAAGGPPTNASIARPWLNTALTVDQRIALLLPVMTLDEKLGQMTQTDVGYVKADPTLVRTYLLGALLSGANPDGTNNATNW